ncbi:C6 transcription factor [Eremomyces bilateralis CBS 781.70]|uniref:C6 transcription factor n=1 Tax=Eremomyces bilateralis CBS 781.70 TaxID=1392243 RepID=A0A6G1GEA6_9PEZI|nr:C6 transcription factor [Eremomyces bilateralis CBS 781.70]KAF1816221.1 C6 transcription factor [Eremomyces bilateralis CBS 781.70]
MSHTTNRADLILTFGIGNHCIKNNVTCEGYPPRDYWQSGRQRLMKVARRNSHESPRTLPTLIDGVENDMDWLLLNHFQLGVSKVLSLCMERNNPFKELFMPMAMQHKGLMHSLLCLAGTHLITKDKEANLVAYQERQSHHYSLALQILRTDTNLANARGGDQKVIIDDPTTAQTVLLCLNTITAGDVSGEYRTHMDIARFAMQRSNAYNNDFRGFIYEFFVYHDVSNSITAVDRPNILMSEDFQLPEYMMQQPALGNFLGVMDGLFLCMSRIRSLRDRVRARSQSGEKPVVDFQILSEAQGIDQELRDWTSTQPLDSPRWTLSMLYRQCTWIYLHRTILPSVPNAQLSMAVEEGLAFLRHLPSDSSTQSLVLMPLFLLGCAAFDETQRPTICEAFDNLMTFSSLGNIVHARKILGEVWRRMDAGLDSWDWESIIQEMGLDFLIT